MQENDLYQELVATKDRVPAHDMSVAHSIASYAHLVRQEVWQQRWNPESRTLEPLHEVAGGIWSEAIQRCLDEHGSVWIPEMEKPLYLDQPLVLRSGNHLLVHPNTEIRLRVGARGTCMVRNAGIAFSQDRPVDWCAGADTGIVIEGGIWSDQRNEGRGRGGAFDEQDSMPGSHGALLLHNVSGIVARNMRFRDCSAFAIQLGNANDFVLENITFDETADGVHIEGPAAHGVIQHIGGKTNDDAVALNAWDWDNSSLTFGPITDVLIEDIETPAGHTWSELRLLAGTKIFPNGERVDCDIRRCIWRNIRGVHTFKMYDQPNISKPEQDYADPIGKMSDLFFADIVVEGIRQEDYYDKSSDGVLDICADIDNLSIRDVRFNYTPGPNDMAPYLVAVGPKALTWPRGPKPEDGWKEVFNPNANPVVRGIIIQGVYVPDPHQPGRHIPCQDLAGLVCVRQLSLNPDFPRSMPRGGVGQGQVVDMVLDGVYTRSWTRIQGAPCTKSASSNISKSA